MEAGVATLFGWFSLAIASTSTIFTI